MILSLSKRFSKISKKCLIILSLFLFTAGCYGQIKYVAEWDKNPVLHKTPKNFEKESAVYLYDQRIIEYMKNEQKGNLEEIHTTYHTLIKVNDEKGVEQFNKIYIPVRTGAAVLSLKARTITPAGKVIELPSNKIFDVEEDGTHYKKFALEGVEKGSEIEYIYTKKYETYFFGTEYFQSSSVPYQHAEFVLIIPDYLSFDVKGYNGFTNIVDTINDKRHIYTASEDNIPTLEDEKYSSRSPMLKNIQFKLSYNNYKGKDIRIFTWSELAKNVYTSYNTFSDKELKAATNFLGEINIKDNAGEEEKVRAIEEYIKTNIINSSETTGPEASELDKIIKTKKASDDGITRLYAALLNKLNIKYQMAYPSKRDALPIDENFENYNLVNEIVFKISSTEQFLSPTDRFFRYPFIDPYWAATKGLYLKGTSIGDFKTAIAAFDTIPMVPYEKNYHILSIKANLDPTNDTLVIHLTQNIAGYNAIPYRPAYSYLQSDKIDEFNKSNVESILKSDLITNIKVQHTEMSNFFIGTPLIIDADIKCLNLLEHAGKKLLIKIGEAIGPQEQMYQEKPRQLPVVMQYPHALDREISFTIPAGYSVQNPKDLNFHVVHKSGDIETMGFISDYSINGNQLLIKIHEFYKTVYYPLSDFNQFKNVINASADFNKVVLVLEKKS